jgi:hypothetical protein
LPRTGSNAPKAALGAVDALLDAIAREAAHPEEVEAGAG